MVALVSMGPLEEQPWPMRPALYDGPLTGFRAHHELLRREVLKMWEQEGIAVGRLEDLVTAGAR